MDGKRGKTRLKSQQVMGVVENKMQRASASEEDTGN